VYIVDQFQRYGDGHRYDPWMANLAKTFSQEDKIKLAIYFSQQTMKPIGGGEPALRERGKEVFREYCMECHGEDGRGKEGYARLAGQSPEYIVKMLNEFKTPGSNRSNPWMFARANMIKSEEDMRAVATYLANLN
jgi:cytochrome c553